MIQAPDDWAVVEDGRVIAGEGATPNLPWWSFGKSVIAFAAMNLVEKRKLDLDAPHLGAPYTLRQLLRHRSGLADYGPLRDYHEAVARGDEPWPLEELERRCAAEQLRFTPGTRFLYSNIGYEKVCRAIEQAHGAPLGEALHDLVLGPAGVSAKLAARDEEVTALPPNYHLGWVYHGLIAGSVAEAALVLDAFAHGAFMGPALADEARRLIPIGFPTPGRPVRLAGYGLGLMGEADPAAPPLYGHTGGGPDTLIVVRTDGRRTVAAFGGGEDQGALEREAEARLAGGYPR